MKRGCAAAGLALALFGCGAPERLSGAEREQARGTLVAYAGALAARDGDAACATLTRKMRERSSPSPVGCPRALVELARLLEFSRPVEVQLPADRWNDGSAHGVVEYRSGAGASGGEVVLRQEGDRWLIDEDLRCITPGCGP